MRSLLAAGVTLLVVAAGWFLLARTPQTNPPNEMPPVALRADSADAASVATGSAASRASTKAADIADKLNPSESKRGTGEAPKLNGFRTGGKLALLVGINDYADDDNLGDLQWAENDVAEFGNALIAGGFHSDNVRILTARAGEASGGDLSPTYDNVLRHLHEILDECGPKDTVILGFAGHGIQFAGQAEAYFCPADANLAAQPHDRRLIPMTKIYSLLADCEAKAKLLLCDACRNDPNQPTRASGKKRAALRPRGFQEELLQKTVGLAACFSCSNAEFAWEDKELRHGIFFYHLIEALKGKADFIPEPDGQVDVNELLTYAIARTPRYVKTKYDRSQTPHDIRNLSGLIELVATREPLPQPTKPDPTPPPTPSPDPTAQIAALQRQWDAAQLSLIKQQNNPLLAQFADLDVELLKVTTDLQKQVKSKSELDRGDVGFQRTVDAFQRSHDVAAIERRMSDLNQLVRQANDRLKVSFFDPVLKRPITPAERTMLNGDRDAALKEIKDLTELLDKYRTALGALESSALRRAKHDAEIARLAERQTTLQDELKAQRAAFEANAEAIEELMNTLDVVGRQLRALGVEAPALPADGRQAVEPGSHDPPGVNDHPASTIGSPNAGTPTLLRPSSPAGPTAPVLKLKL